MNRVLKILLPVLVASTAAFLPAMAGLSHANGDAVEIFRAQEGAYELVVGVQPSTPVVGRTHLTLTLLNVSTSLPVVHAEIKIVAQKPDGEPAYEVRAVNLPLSIKYYDANITFESPGDWTLMVSVHHDTLGRVTFAVPFHVGEQAVGASLAGTIVWLAVLGTLAGGSVYVWYRARRRTERA